MEREIKFRGRCRESKKWVYGSLFKNAYASRIIPFDSIITQQDVIDNYYTVLQSTVGQYTGLKDKNGVEIYEGDIVIREEEGCDKKYVSKYQVVFEECCFCLKVIDSEIFKTGAIIRHMEECEVIGNIYVSQIEEVCSLNKSDSPEANNCTHENTVFQNIRCNVCSDCHVIIETDV